MTTTNAVLYSLFHLKDLLFIYFKNRNRNWRFVESQFKDVAWVSVWDVLVSFAHPLQLQPELGGNGLDVIRIAYIL